MSKIAVKDLYSERARQIFLSVDINPNEEEIKYVKELLKDSAKWTSLQINLTKILVNIKDKDLFLNVIKTINEVGLNQTIKEEIIKGIANLSEDKIKSEINSVLYYIKEKEMKEIIQKYKDLCCINEIVFRLGRLSIRKSKKEMTEIINILNQPETLETVKTLTEKYEGEKRDLVIGELIHLISNSDLNDFIEVRKKLPEIITTLKNEYNIVHFGRHSSKIIIQLYKYAADEIEKKELEKKEQSKKEKVFIFTYAYSDHNGAFYSDARHNDELSKYGKVLIIEASSDVELLMMLQKMKEKHGLFNGVFIAGHGEPTRIKLGNEETLYSFLDVTDYDIMSKIGEMINKEDKNNFIALVSCSTGDESTTRSLANAMASAARVSNVYAPDNLFTMYEIKVEKEKNKKSKKNEEEKITITYHRVKGYVQTMKFGIKN